MAMTHSTLTRGIEVGSWVRYQGITRVVSDVYEPVPGFDGRSLDLVGSEGQLVATVDESEVELVHTITVTYQACARCGEAAGECACRPMVIGITY